MSFNPKTFPIFVEKRARAKNAQSFRNRRLAIPRMYLDGKGFFIVESRVSSERFSSGKMYSITLSGKTVSRILSFFNSQPNSFKRLDLSIDLRNGSILATHSSKGFISCRRSKANRQCNFSPVPLPQTRVVDAGTTGAVSSDS